MPGEVPLHDATSGLFTWVPSHCAEAHAAHLKVVRVCQREDLPMLAFLEAMARRFSYGCAPIKHLDDGAVSYFNDL